MKKLFVFTVFFAAVCFVGCSEKKSPTSATEPAANTDSSNNKFFPVTSFLKGQFNTLDSLPITFLKITTSGSKADSAWIKRDSIRHLLEPFITDDISDEKLHAFFKESKFNDQSTDAITLTYQPKTTLPDSIAIRNWTVYINPETGNINRVYILKQLKQNNEIFVQQLTWETDKWAKLLTIMDKPGGESKITSNIKLVWDLRSPTNN